MTWATKKCDWNLISSDIEKELEANIDVIPAERVADVRHYLTHGELSMAFEYLYLEIIEKSNSKMFLSPDRVKELATLFSLDDEVECMIDHEFWKKLTSFIELSR